LTIETVKSEVPF